MFYYKFNENYLILSEKKLSGNISKLCGRSIPHSNSLKCFKEVKKKKRETHSIQVLAQILSYSNKHPQTGSDGG